MSFATPGWDLNASAIAPEQALSKAAQKKRKHQEASANGATEEAPAVNVEALLTKFHALEQKNKPKPTSKKGKDGAKGQAGSKNEMPADGPVSKGAANKESGKGEAGKKRQRNKRNKQQQKIAVEPSSEPDVSFATAPSSPDRSEMLLEEPSKKKQRRGSGASTNKNPESMSTLQSSMKTKLGGARFRWINEQLVNLLKVLFMYYLTITIIAAVYHQRRRSLAAHGKRPLRVRRGTFSCRFFLRRQSTNTQFPVPYWLPFSSSDMACASSRHHHLLAQRLPTCPFLGSRSWSRRRSTCARATSEHNLQSNQL